jgi:hypothetical protein
VPVRRLVLTDLDRGTVHEFRDADVRIGRDPACELPVVEAPAGAEIAGVHARLAPRATGWCLTDERTKGGTFVNHVRLVGSDQAILRTGDVIRLGVGSGARRYRVARIETLASPRPASPSGARADGAREAAADMRLAAGAVGGASLASAAAALAPRASNAQLAAGAAAGTAVASAAAGVASSRLRTSSAGTSAAAPAAAGSSGVPAANAALGVAAVAGAAAGTAGVASLAGSGKGLESWRAARLFEAAGSLDSAAPAAAAKAGANTWAGIAAGTMVVAGAAGAYQVMRPTDAAGARVVIAAVADAGGSTSVTTPASNPASASTDGAKESASAAIAPKAESESARRLAAAAGSAGNVLGEVSAWYRGRRVRVTGIVMAEAGTMLTAAEAVSGPAGARPDSIVVSWPRGGKHRAVPGATAGALGVITLQQWRGQWLGQAAQGDASSTPTWVAIVGFDRDNAAPVVVAGEAAAARVANAVEVRDASDRLLPGAPVVDARGYVVGLWTGGARGVPLADALRLVVPR